MEIGGIILDIEKERIQFTRLAGSIYLVYLFIYRIKFVLEYLLLMSALALFLRFHFLSRLLIFFLSTLFNFHFEQPAHYIYEQAAQKTILGKLPF